jgi:NADH dehydrogenase
MKQLLVIGGGFAGVWGALSAASEADRQGGGISVTVVSPDDQLTLRPRLYESDLGAMRTPLAPTFAAAGIDLVQGTAQAIDTETRRVTVALAGGGEQVLAYDRLLLAAGSILKPLPVPGAAEYAFSIDDFASAAAFDAHLAALAAAPGRPGGDGFVVVGSGLTGLEMATEMRARIAAHGGDDMVARARVYLIEQADVLAPDLGAAPRPVFETALAQAGVEVRLGAAVADIDAAGVTLSDGTRIDAATVVLVTGLQANPLAAGLKVPTDALGRLVVDEMLRVSARPEIYAAGDIAHAMVDDEHVAVMSCQHAMPMGKAAGYNMARDLLGLPLRPYRQERYVTCVDLGPYGAVFTNGWQREVQMTGADAKARKTFVMEKVIYPPTGDREAVLGAAHLDA